MQCSTQHFSMPTHCPAFLCRAIALPNKAMLLSAIALRYIAAAYLLTTGRFFSTAIPFSALPWPSLSRLFLGNSKPRPSFANHRSGIAEPLHNLSLPLLRFTLPCLALCFGAIPWHCSTLPCYSTAERVRALLCLSYALSASCHPLVQCITSSPGYGERLTGKAGNLTLGHFLPCETPHA